MGLNKGRRMGQVFFIGAGPGDPELITVKGQRLIREAQCVIYAGSLVPETLINQARPDAVVRDSSAMTLEETHELIREVVTESGNVARVHTGDPSLYGAIREQMLLLEHDAIPYSVVPGVTAAFAAAAVAGVSFTVPEATQCLTITRVAGRTPVPAGQEVRDLAAHGGSLAVYLSGADAGGLAAQLRLAKLPEDTPIIAAYRVGWPEQRIMHMTLASLEERMEQESMRRQLVFLVLPGEKAPRNAASKLYDKSFSHGWRTAQE